MPKRMRSAAPSAFVLSSLDNVAPYEYRGPMLIETGMPGGLARASPAVQSAEAKRRGGSPIELPLLFALLACGRGSCARDALRFHMGRRVVSEL